METSVAAVTVREVEPEIAPEVAVIVVTPTELERAEPLELMSLLMVAMLVADELHVTEEVRS